jgi:hypothetical protein
MHTPAIGNQAMRQDRIAIATIVIGLGAAIAPAASGMSPKGEAQKGEAQKPAIASAVAVSSIGLSLGTSQRLRQPGQFDMTFMPDMHHGRPATARSVLSRLHHKSC